MKQLTKNQVEIVEKIKSLTGLSFETRPLKKTCFLIDLPAGQRVGHSDFEIAIIRVVNQYDFGKIQQSGINALALVN